MNTGFERCYAVVIQSGHTAPDHYIALREGDALLLVAALAAAEEEGGRQTEDGGNSGLPSRPLSGEFCECITSAVFACAVECFESLSTSYFPQEL